MLTRVQLNLLGRRSYLSSVVSLATGSNSATISLENNDDDNSAQAYGDDFEVNRKYLTFSWWLLNKGWLDIAQRVEAAVRQVFGQTNPRDQLSLETFAAMTGQVRRLVEGSAAFSDPSAGTGATAPTKWLPFLLPPPDMEEYVLRESGILDDSAASVTRAQGEEGQSPPKEQQQSPPPSSPSSTASLRRLLDETSDLIEAPAFTHVLTQLLDAGFATLLDTKLAQGAFDLPPPAAQASSTSETAPPPTIDATGAAVVGPEQLRQRRRAEHKVLLPKCLSVLTKQAHAIGAGAGASASEMGGGAGGPNEYLQAMEGVRDLEGFAALVYSSNWENEVRPDEMMPAPSSSSVTATTTAWSSVRESRVLGLEGEGEGSLVLVEPSQGSFESAWARATEKKGGS